MASAFLIQHLFFFSSSLWKKKHEKVNSNFLKNDDDDDDDDFPPLLPQSFFFFFFKAARFPGNTHLFELLPLGRRFSSVISQDKALEEQLLSLDPV